jgi:hypothetical protein
LPEILTGTDLPLDGQRLDGLALQVIFGAVVSVLLDVPPDGSPLPDPLEVGKSPYATTVFEKVGTNTLPSAITLRIKNVMRSDGQVYAQPPYAPNLITVNVRIFPKLEEFTFEVFRTLSVRLAAVRALLNCAVVMVVRAWVEDSDIRYRLTNKAQRTKLRDLFFKTAKLPIQHDGEDIRGGGTAYGL